MSKSIGNLERVLRPALDKVVETRYAPAQEFVQRLTRENPEFTTEQIVDLIVRR